VVLHSGRLWPYLETLDYAGKACPRKSALAYYKHFVNYSRKKVFNIET
jgi:hypothetical protein